MKSNWKKSYVLTHPNVPTFSWWTETRVNDQGLVGTETLAPRDMVDPIWLRGRYSSIKERFSFKTSVYVFCYDILIMFSLRSDEIVNANSSTKRAYKRVKYFPEWYHWSGGHLLTTTKVSNDTNFWFMFPLESILLTLNFFATQFDRKKWKNWLTYLRKWMKFLLTSLFNFQYFKIFLNFKFPTPLPPT